MWITKAGIKNLGNKLYGYLAPAYDKNYFIERLNTCKEHELIHLRNKFKGREDEAIEWLCEIVLDNKNNSAKLRSKTLECISYFILPRNQKLKKETQEKLKNVLLNCLDDPSNDIKYHALEACCEGLSIKTPEFIKKVKELSNTTDPKLLHKTIDFLPYFEDPEAIQILKNKLTASTLKLQLGNYSWGDVHAHRNLCEAVEEAYTFGMGNTVFAELEKIVKAGPLEKEKLRYALLEKCNEYTKIYGRKDVSHVLARYLLLNDDKQLKEEALNCLSTLADKETIIETLFSAFNSYGPSYIDAHTKKYLSLQAGFALESKEKGISVQKLVADKYFPDE